jgi:purine-nucleoside phosphorylase
MSLHIGAKENDIAETVLISGDPLRAKYIAEKMLTDTICYNEVRGMLGFTGNFDGKRVSVQGTGMGIPSTAIYVHELIHGYGVKKIIRIGTTGALQANLELGEIILAMAAYTDSATNLLFHPSMETPSLADATLLQEAINAAANKNLQVHEGDVFSTDTFYHPDTNRWEQWITKGLLGIEMETSIIYAMAKKYNVQALSILSVSDNLITQKFTTAKEREEVSTKMVQLALELI